jgi:hypothetical protein
MYLGLQDVVALGIVSLAVFYLARLSWNAVAGKRGGACGSGCGKCSTGETFPNANSGVPDQVVSLGDFK